jgi:hypothetical protein
VSYVVIDTSRAEEPFLVFTGGDLLVGAVGRPDLLGRELGERLAPRLYESLHQKLLPLGDHVIVFPTHGGGSLCGRGIAGTRFSTIGVAKVLSSVARCTDIIGRWGGEEFVVALTDTNPEQGAIAAERYRRAIEELRLVDASGVPFSVTASFGVAGYVKGDDVERLIDRADRTMYAAKSSGRNRVEVNDQGLPLRPAI